MRIAAFLENARCYRHDSGLALTIVAAVALEPIGL